VKAMPISTANGNGRDWIFSSGVMGYPLPL
jgi:hypothetical protein